MSRLNQVSIEAGLNTYFIGKSGSNEIWDELASTNDRAIELAKEGAAEGVFVIARKQTSGRGRQGRSWVSPQDSGIFLSVLLRPTIDTSMMPLLSFAGGVAACQAIEQVCGLRIGLKWVNDLVYGGKKLGGILAEMPGAQETERKQGAVILPPAVILGLGLNLALPADSLPEEIREHVESLDNIAGKEVDANQIVAEFCNALEEQYNHLRHGFQELVIAEWKKYSETLGKKIKATLGHEELLGTAEDIADSGALILRLENGERRELHAGEITIRLADGSYA